MLTFGAIVARHRPKWVVFENVPGLLSSGAGRDFASLLGLLSGQRITPPADGWKSSGIVAGYPNAYGLAWRVLDAQYVRVDAYPRAVPQRRQRVFVVGCLGDWRSAAAVLLERESLRGDSAPRRSAGSRITTCLDAGPDIGGDGSRVSRLVTGADMVAYGGNQTSGPRAVASALSALSAHGGACGRLDFETETFVAHTLRGEGFDASEDGTGRGTPLVPWGVRQTAPTLTTTYGKQPDSSDTNAGPMLVPMREAVPFDTTQITSASNYSNPKAGDPCHPLAAGAHAPAIAIRTANTGANGHGFSDGVAHTLDQAQGQAVAFGWQNAAAQGMAVDTISPTLDKSKHPGAMHGAAVRRLMPSECEALQGFPQGYTAIPWRGKPASECPDGPRYKALGNSWACNVARWVGRRISLVEQINMERVA